MSEVKSRVPLSRKTKWTIASLALCLVLVGCLILTVSVVGGHDVVFSRMTTNIPSRVTSQRLMAINHGDSASRVVELLGHPISSPEGRRHSYARPRLIPLHTEVYVQYDGFERVQSVLVKMSGGEQLYWMSEGDKRVLESKLVAVLGDDGD